MSTTPASHCPLCPRGCDLTAPHCGRGAAYAQTGEAPAQGNASREAHHHEHGRSPAHAPHLSFEKPEQQQVMKYLHHAVRAADHGGFSQADTASMFLVLTDEETAQLAILLKKLADHWQEVCPRPPVFR